MQRTVITVHMSQSQVRDAAMRQSGLDPRAMAMKPGTRVERDRKVAAKRGYQKHKGRGWE